LAPRTENKNNKAKCRNFFLSKPFTVLSLFWFRL
jgi:hypothetical protein